MRTEHKIDFSINEGDFEEVKFVKLDEINITLEGNAINANYYIKDKVFEIRTKDKDGTMTLNFNIKKKLIAVIQRTNANSQSNY